jgi:hypothetical protein
MIDLRDENPDRSVQYKDTDPAKLRDQLNENWRQLRLLRTAVSDRDEVIGTLHGSIHRRDEVIAAQAKSIKLFNRARPLMYAAIGAVSAEVAKWAGSWLVGIVLHGGRK